MAPPIRGMSTGIEQRITAGNDFDGLAPTTTPAYDGAKRLEQWPTDTQGGLIDFEQTEVVVVTGIDIKFGGQTSWTLSRVFADATEAGWLFGTNESVLVVGGEDTHIRLLPGMKLKLVSAGASSAMTVWVYVRSESGEG